MIQTFREGDTKLIITAREEGDEGLLAIAENLINSPAFYKYLKSEKAKQEKGDVHEVR